MLPASISYPVSTRIWDTTKNRQAETLYIRIRVFLWISLKRRYISTGGAHAAATFGEKESKRPDWSIMCPKPTVLAAALHVAALLSFSSANAPGSGVIGGRVCDTFHVHEAHTQSTGMASYNAEIIVKNSSGHRVQCYQPSQQHYTGTLRFARVQC